MKCVFFLLFVNCVYPFYFQSQMRNIGYWRIETFGFETRTVFFVKLCLLFVKYAFFLYGCETWSLTLREESRLRVFEKRVLRRIFGPKRDKVKGE